jgi:hypothetical protein
VLDVFPRDINNFTIEFCTKKKSVQYIPQPADVLASVDFVSQTPALLRTPLAVQLVLDGREWLLPLVGTGGKKVKGYGKVKVTTPDIYIYINVCIVNGIFITAIEKQ